MSTILGIDPGATGGLAFVGPHSYRACTTPATERGIFEAIAEADPSFAVIEVVHSFPGAGVASMFTFGRGYGFIRGVLTAMSIPFEEVRPQVWQAAFVPKKDKVQRPGKEATREERLRYKVANAAATRDHKRRLLAKAQQLFPDIKITQRTADAVLIAEYGRRKFFQAKENA